MRRSTIIAAVLVLLVPALAQAKGDGDPGSRNTGGSVGCACGGASGRGLDAGRHGSGAGGFGGAVGGTDGGIGIGGTH